MLIRFIIQFILQLVPQVIVDYFWGGNYGLVYIAGFCVGMMFQGLCDRDRYDYLRNYFKTMQQRYTGKPPINLVKKP